MYSKIELKKFETVKDNNGYYINAKYEVTDEYGNIYERIYDHVPLNVCSSHTPIIRRELDMYRVNETLTINFGFGELVCNRETKIEEHLIYEATREMTLEEIEKKLGHRVKIVSKDA